MSKLVNSRFTNSRTFHPIPSLTTRFYNNDVLQIWVCHGVSLNRKNYVGAQAAQVRNNLHRGGPSLFGKGPSLTS